MTPSTGRRAVRVALAIVLLPIAVATVRAIVGDWYPIGDNGYFALRARDVLTDHHPLLGTWTSASKVVGQDINNPGPLYFDALAIPAKIDLASGLAIAIALLNGTAIAIGAIFARRRGGPRLVLAYLAMAAALCWSMGSELLFDPWQPHSLLLPFFLFLVLVWSLASGDEVALPWAVGVASFVVQTHVSYLYLVAIIGAWGIGAFVWHVVRLRRADPDAWMNHRRRLRRAGAVAVAVAALCWSQPVLEQLTADDGGNLRHLAASADAQQRRVGPRLGVELAAAVLASPPGWARPSMRETLSVDPVALGGFPRLHGVRSLGVAVAGLLAVGGLLAVALVAARRRRDETALTLAATAGVVFAAGVVATVVMPYGPFGVVAPHHLRFLWPVGAFVTGAVAISLGRALPRSIRQHRSATGVLLATCAVVALANLPTWSAETGPLVDADSIPVVRSLMAQLGPLEGSGPLLIDFSTLRFAEPYSGPLMAELQRRGIEFRTIDEPTVRQVGESRRAGVDVTSMLVIREGDAADATPRGWERIAFVPGLGSSQRTELDDATAAVAELIAGGRLRLTADGRDAARRGFLPVTNDQLDAADPDGEAVVASGELFVLFDSELLELAPTDVQLVGRYVELQRRWDRFTVAIFLVPLGP